MNIKPDSADEYREISFLAYNHQPTVKTVGWMINPE